MAIVLTVNAVEQAYLSGTLVIQESVHGRGVASLVMQSATGTYRPTRFWELIVTLNGTRLFGGMINMIDESGIGNEPIIGIQLNLDCIDFNAYADWKNVVNGGFPAGTTLETALNATLGHLTGYGVTIDGAQVTGPALPLLEYDVRTITSIHEEISQITGYAIEIDHNKVLRGYIPGTTAAPFDILDTNEYAIGDIVIEGSDTDPATDAIGRFGNGAREIIDHFTGTNTVFAINYYPLIAHRGYVNVGGTVTDGVISGGVNETFSIGGGGTWDYDPATGLITRSSSVDGTTVNFQYTAQFPIAITASVGGSPTREVVFMYPEIFDRVTAQAALDADLDRVAAQARRVRYTTYTTGLRPGMQQRIQTSKRNFDEECYIEELTTTHLEGEFFRYDVVLVEGVLLLANWRDTLKEWAEYGTGGGAAVSGVSIPPIGGGGNPAPPNLAVQYNASGSFGGSANLTFNPATNCLVGGDGSSITATSPDSCFVFGNNCHVVDP